MYRITEAAVINGDVAQVWAIATDVSGWPAWDPHEEAARLDGPFAAGTTGWSKPKGAPAANWTITAVEAGRMWSSACGLPGGELRGVNIFDVCGPATVRCTKTVMVTGPLVPLFRLWFGPRIRRDMRRTFAALQVEAARRTRVG